MPSPSTALSTLRPDLAGSFEEYGLALAKQGFIATEVMPVVEVAKQAGTFGKISIEELLKNRDTKRAPGAPYSRDKWTFLPATFATEEHGLEDPVDDREATMYREFFDAEQMAAVRARAGVMIEAEKRAAALLYNATTWTSHTTGITEEWDTPAAAVPRAGVKAAMLAVWAASGLWANALSINHKQFEHLKDVAAVIDRLKYAGFKDPDPASITKAALAQALGIERVIVAGSAKNAAIEGQSISIASVWSDEYAMVAKVATSQDAREPCVARTFHWGEDGSDIGGTVESYRDESCRSDIVRVRHDVDEIVMYVEAAHLLSNVITI